MSYTNSGVSVFTTGSQIGARPTTSVPPIIIDANESGRITRASKPSGYAQSSSESS
jgi:hypothetical protein